MLSAHSHRKVDLAFGYVHDRRFDQIELDPIAGRELEDMRLCSDAVQLYLRPIPRVRDCDLRDVLDLQAVWLQAGH